MIPAIGGPDVIGVHTARAPLDLRQEVLVTTQANPAGR
jgi:hypothetical protein